MISINERGGINAVKPVENKPVDKGIDPRFHNIKVKEHKEGWAAGGSEIDIVAYSGYNNPNNSRGWTWVGDPYSRRIIDLTRSEISNKTARFINFTYYPNWQPNCTPVECPSGPWGDCFAFAVFEHDAWPVGTKTRTVRTPLGRDCYIPYRSSDEAYCSNYILYPNAYNFSITSSSIELRTWY